MRLVIGNKKYSSWSMRPWLVLTHFAIPFDEVRVWLDQPDTTTQILRYAPSGRVPCLVTADGHPVWDSLAICETLAELFPERALWPQDARERAHARSLCAEMHAGFTELRTQMWMNLGADFAGKGATPGALADVARIDESWTDCLTRYGGPFLFGGEFTIADAFYAPVVMRFNTYRPPLSDAAAGYAERITALPAVRQWIEAARAEARALPKYDVHD